jgi:membrane protease YdiL (CAAX protease family)
VALGTTAHAAGTEATLLLTAGLVAATAGTERRKGPGAAGRLGLRHLAFSACLYSGRMVVMAVLVAFALGRPASGWRPMRVDAAPMVLGIVLPYAIAAEVLLRGFLFRRLRPRLRLGTSVLITAVVPLLGLIGSVLLPGPTWPWLVAVVVSLPGGLLFERTASVWPGVVLHGGALLPAVVLPASRPPRGWRSGRDCTRPPAWRPGSCPGRAVAADPPGWSPFPWRSCWPSLWWSRPPRPRIAPCCTNASTLCRSARSSSPWPDRLGRG